MTTIPHRFRAVSIPKEAIPMRPPRAGTRSGSRWRRGLLMSVGLSLALAQAALGSTGAVYYVADQTLDGRHELLRKDLKTGETCSIDETVRDFLSARTESPQFAIDPKGRSALYIQYDDSDCGQYNLVRKNLQTGMVTRINDPLADCGGVQEFVIGPKGRFVIFRAEHTTEGVHGLFSANLKTGVVTRLDRPLGAGHNVEDFAVDPRGEFVLYSTYEYRLYHVDLKTRVVTTLNSAPRGGAHVYEYAIGPKGQFVVYRGTQDSGRIALYQVALKTGTTTRLNDPLRAGDQIFDFAIDPRRKFVAYIRRNDGEQQVLLRKDLRTGAITALYHPQGVGPGVYDFAVDPKGKFVVYRAKQRYGERTDLYHANSRTGVITKINNASGVRDYAIGPKGKFVVYSQYTDDGAYGLFHVDLRTRVVRKISDDLVIRGNVENYVIDPKGRFVVYRADQTNDGIYELFSADLKTGVVTRISDTLVAGGHISGYTIERPRPFTCETRTVFVTSGTYTGNLGGLDGADAICRDVAAAAGLAGSYRAWLTSDSSSRPAWRFSGTASLPYVLVDGTLIANDWADLVDGALAAPINKDETGALVPTSAVWTSIDTDGTHLGPGADCLNWSSASSLETGILGNSGKQDGGWTSDSFNLCDQKLPIYCFQQ